MAVSLAVGGRGCQSYGHRGRHSSTENDEGQPCASSLLPTCVDTRILRAGMASRESISTWPLRSLCFRTDLFLAAQWGEVIPRERYVVVRSPSNPHFWWGNFLLYRDPPSAEDAGDHGWLADYRREIPFGTAPLLAWDRPDGARGEASAFEAFGFALDEGTILTATTNDLVRPSRFDDAIEVRPLASEQDWSDAVRVQTSAFSARRSGTLEDLRDFVERQHALFRPLHDRGIGRWWGAWASGKLVGSLGLVRIDDELARFQLVGVDPEYGRRGVCSTMTHHVARHAFDDGRLRALVMAADATYHAAKVYESCGFQPTEHLVAVIKKQRRG